MTNGKLPIVGVGGVMNPLDALAKLEAGATLVQILHRPRVCRAWFGEANQSALLGREA